MSTPVAVLGEVALLVREPRPPDGIDVLAAVAEVLGRLVQADLTGWNDVEMTDGRATVRSFPDPALADETSATLLLETAVDNPMVASYLSPASADDLSPRRMSDLIGDLAWRRTRTYREMLQPLGGEHQATVLTTPFRASGGHAWAFNRSGSDFADHELDVLREVQPLLAIIDRVVGKPLPSPAAERHGLTAREAELLGHLANGLTADAIGALCGISGRTVRKHLEHAYAKLGAHDKVTAVLRYRALTTP